MAKGRKKLPQEVLDLRGTARKDRQRPTAVSGPKIDKYDIRAWTVPGYELLTDRARKIYARACRNCITIKILSAQDFNQLLAYAREYDLYLDAVEDVQKNGRTYSYLDKFDQRHYYDNPAVHQANNALRNIQAIGSNFGFSPVDRQKLHIKEAEDPMAAIKRIMAVQVDFENEDSEPDNQ